MNEEWRPFPGFENDYLISNIGRVWSIRSEKCLQLKTTPAGYLRVSPSVNGYRVECPVHRMVALAFIPNPDNKPTVNHINEVKTDNRVENLEWATVLENNTHGTRTERAMKNTDWDKRTANMDYSAIASKHNYFEINKAQMKPVCQLDKKGNVIAIHNGVAVAARAVGVSPGGVCGCLKERRKTCGGYQWKYA